MVCLDRASEGDATTRMVKCAALVAALELRYIATTSPAHRRTAARQAADALRCAAGLWVLTFGYPWCTWGALGTHGVLWIPALLEQRREDPLFSKHEGTIHIMVPSCRNGAWTDVRNKGTDKFKYGTDNRVTGTNKRN